MSLKKRPNVLIILEALLRGVEVKFNNRTWVWNDGPYVIVDGHQLYAHGEISDFVKLCEQATEDEVNEIYRQIQATTTR